MSTQTRIYRLAELSTEQIQGLSRDKTVILLPGGIVEEHGPYLPSFTDGYQNESLTDALASAIVARPEWTAVIFPTIPLGSGGANEIGRKYSFPGTYAVRPATVRAVFMDLASEFGEQGFQWIFVVHEHGSPDHNRSLEQACDFFRDTYGGHMVHLCGLRLPSESESPMKQMLGAEALGEDGFTVHGGLAEHATMLHLRSDLVQPGWVNAIPVTGTSLADLITLAELENWPGYFGSPRFASAQLGEQLVQRHIRDNIKLALAILDGMDEREVPRYADIMYKLGEIPLIMGRSRDRDDQRERQQQEWLHKRLESK